jgi:hypothetical protein
MKASLRMAIQAKTMEHATAPWWWRVAQWLSWRANYLWCALAGGPTRGEKMLISILNQNRAERRARESIGRKAVLPIKKARK